MMQRRVMRKRSELRRRLPGSPPQRLGSVVAKLVAYSVVYGSYGAAYAVAYVKEVRHAHREGANKQEPGRGA